MKTLTETYVIPNSFTASISENSLAVAINSTDRKYQRHYTCSFLSVDFYIGNILLGGSRFFFILEG
jgi:hypothetical protein